MTRSDGAEILREFGRRFASAREAFRNRDLERALRLFADAVGGPATYDRRSEGQRRMMMDNALAHVADAVATRPRPIFTCGMARGITVPTLLTNGARSPEFFQRILDELERCLTKCERVTVPGAAHTVPWENPQGYDDTVLAFLAKHG